MFCWGKDMGQLLMHYKDIRSIGILPIETSPDPSMQHVLFLCRYKSGLYLTFSVVVNHDILTSFAWEKWLKRFYNLLFSHGNDKGYDINQFGDFFFATYKWWILWLSMLSLNLLSHFSHAKLVNCYRCQQTLQWNYKYNSMLSMIRMFLRCCIW